MSKPIFEETKFVADVLNEYYANNYTNYSIIYDKYFNIVLETYDNKELLERYCTNEEIEEAKECYKSNYIESKLNLVLFNIILNAIVKKN
jgi:uncharacterized membrane protein